MHAQDFISGNCFKRPASDLRFALLPLAVALRSHRTTLEAVKCLSTNLQTESKRTKNELISAMFNS
jgi:hypothetical protein